MRDAQVRRLPVVDATGGLVGILSLSDLVRRTEGRIDGFAKHVISALAGICEPHAARGTEARPRLRRQERREEESLRPAEFARRDSQPQCGESWSRAWEKSKKKEELGEHSRAAVVEAVKKLENSLRPPRPPHN